MTPAGDRYPQHLKWIREKVRSGEYSISEHVIRFILFGKITVSDIENALEVGLITEVRENRQKQVAWLIRGRINGNIVSVLCTKGRDDGLMILLALRDKISSWKELDWIRAQEGGFMTDKAHWCFFCGGKIEPVVVGNFDYRLDGNLYVVKNVPAGLCLDCGEKYISAETAKRINLRVSDNNFNDTEAVRVLSY